jgi:hypothetical protein
MKINPNDFVAVLEVEFDAFRHAAAKHDRCAMVRHVECLSKLAAGVAEHLDPTPQTPEKNESIVAFKEGCVGYGAAPFTPEENAAARGILTALAVGLDHATSIHRFRDWMTYAKPADLVGDVVEVRLRFFQDCPTIYLPKTTVKRLLAEHKAGR